MESGTANPLARSATILDEDNARYLAIANGARGTRNMELKCVLWPLEPVAIPQDALASF